MVPILNVKSVAATIQYYVNVLGFKVDWDSGEPLTYASVSLDGHAIMLCQGGQGHAGTWIWIGVEDVQSLFELFTSRGARVNQRLTNYPWAYEMRIEDPDGHVLRFGSEPRSDQPLATEDPSY
jgi:uncharacterized glyoxalase superfamily protein PhnB